MNHTQHYLVASDFDQTLSYHDSGHTLSDLLGVRDFDAKVAGLASANLVQQGAELAYLLRHDPAFRGVRREHLIEAGKRVRLKHGVHQLSQILGSELGGANFHFVVISAAPREVVQSALAGIIPAENILGTELEWDAHTGEISSVKRVTAGYGKIVAVKDLETRFETSPDHTIYIGDGSSDLYVMHHVNSVDGHTIAVSESKTIGRIAKRTVLSDNAMSVLAPLLEDVLGWTGHDIRALYQKHGLSVQEWDKVRTDWLTFKAAEEPEVAIAA